MLAGIQHAAQGCGGFNRSAHSAVPIWMLGCLDALRIGGGLDGLEGLGNRGDLVNREDWRDWLDWEDWLD